MRLIDLTGTPAEIGHRHGREAAAEIRANLNTYASIFEEDYQLSWRSVRELAGRWREPVADMAPRLEAELKGIAAGAGVDYEDVLVLNARSEVDWTLRGAPPVAECTAFAVVKSPSGTVCTGQTWDYHERCKTVAMRIRAQGLPTVFTITEAGQLARHGANSAGLSLHSNGLDGYVGDIGGCLPSVAARRMVLESSTHIEAVDTAALGHSGGVPLNLLITSRQGECADLELNSFGSRVVRAHGPLVVHGNHYTSDLMAGIDYDPAFPDSEGRTSRLAHLLGEDALCAESSADMVLGAQRALSDHEGFPLSVCTHPKPDAVPVKRVRTIAASVVDLTGGAYYVSDGNPCERPFTVLPWNLYEG